MRIFWRKMLHKAGIKCAIRCKQAHKVRIKHSSAVSLHCLEFCSLISPSRLTRVCVGRLKRLDILAGWIPSFSEVQTSFQVSSSAAERKRNDAETRCGCLRTDGVNP